MGKLRFGTFNVDNLKTNLRYYGFLEQTKYFNEQERELFHHAVWFDKEKHVGLVITRKMFDSDKESIDFFANSSIETFIRSIIDNEELNIEKIFNEKVKKKTEIYNIIEPDTLKSVLETENTLVSIVYSMNREFATKIDYAIGMFYGAEPLYGNSYISMNGIEVEKILKTVIGD